MDPGNYVQMAGVGDSVTYENEFDLNDLLNGVTYRKAVMRRTLAVLENPLRDSQEIQVEWEKIGYVAVESREELEVPAQNGPRPMICPWGLTQIAPPGGRVAGTVVIPTARRAEPIGYFGPIPPDRLSIGENHVAFKIDAQQIVKMAIAAEDLAPTGPLRVAYLAPVAAASAGGAPRRKPGEWILLIRESEGVARTSADAVDPARANPDGPRGVIQAYNNGPSDGSTDYARFGEIEVQYLPLRRGADGAWRSRIESRLMAFQGEKGRILKIASHLLGIEPIMFFA
jgi:hypothetical protein